MILTQEYFVPEKISEARKLTILRPAQAAVAVFPNFESIEAKCRYLPNEMMKIHCFPINKSAGDDEPISLGLSYPL